MSQSRAPTTRIDLRTGALASARLAPHSYLRYANFRHLKLSVALLALAGVAYFVGEPGEARGGGTWVGWGLGGVATAAIVWLMCFAVRKRSYRYGGASLQAWLSAHVYLGFVLILIVPLHAGFQFDWNVHTLPYVLLCGVIATGLFGVGVYAYVPSIMTRVRRGSAIEDLDLRITSLNARCARVASRLPPLYQAAAEIAIQETPVRKRRWAIWRSAASGTVLAAEMIKGDSEATDPTILSDVGLLLQIIARKSEVLIRVRKDRRFLRLLDLWRGAHVVLASATMSAVFVHIFVSLYYR